MRTILNLALAVAATSCTGLVDGSGPESESAFDEIPPVKTPDENELQGAGGRNLTEFWPDMTVPFGENTKMLTFVQIRNEVMRATGRSWIVSGVDQWDANRSILGGADYATSWRDDRSASQKKMVTLRRMAFSVCGDIVTAEAEQPTRTVFTVVDPGATIDAESAAVTDQVRALWTRFFLVEPSPEDVTESLSALGSLQTMTNAREAWRGLCSAYLSSMRFLSY